MPHSSIFRFLGVLLCGAPAVLRAQEPVHDLRVAGLGSDSSIHAFLHVLQRAVDAEDSAAVAQMVRYPLRVNDATSSILVVDTTDFMRRYRGILSPSVRHAIQAQVAESLYADRQGVLIKSGDVWLGCGTTAPDGSSCPRIAIIAVNLHASSPP